MNNLYFNVTRILKAKGMQQKELAKRMGCAPAFVSNALSGNPTLETLQKMADALSVPVAALLREQQEIVGFIEVDGKPLCINSWKDIHDLIDKYEEIVLPFE